MSRDVIERSVIAKMWLAFADRASSSCAVGKCAAAGRAAPAGEGGRPLQVQ